MSDQHVEDEEPAPVAMVDGAEEPVVGGPNDPIDRIRPGEADVDALIRPGAGAWLVGRGDWDGEGPDHFTELERRLIVNLRGCQAWCVRMDDKLSRLMYSMGEVLAVLEEIRSEETLGSD